MNEQFTLTSDMSELSPGQSGTSCEQCHEPFAPRQGSGGKPQRFCSEQCRRQFHAAAPPTRGAGVGAVEVQAPPSQATLPTPAANSRAAPTKPACLLAPQNGIEIERDGYGNLVIRQNNWPEDDNEILIHRDYEQIFIDSLTCVLEIPSIP